ncbi:MAG: hypothetical protein O3B74_09540 [Proteobacteria bacterium]|nr:hypothetical protein [Pseudomonadota bacterium]MDA1309289.1 hypothetical protein [Pseudomonadota bacterium]
MTDARMFFLHPATAPLGGAAFQDSKRRALGTIIMKVEGFSAMKNGLRMNARHANSDHE